MNKTLLLALLILALSVTKAQNESTLLKTTNTASLGAINSSNFKYLDLNNVNAGISNRSDMNFGGIGTATYEVPKGSGKNTNFASALWIGGYDNANQLHGGAQTYRQNGNDFWPGPLDTITATIDTAVATTYDKIWKVSYTDINTFITAFNSGSVIATPDMLTWPAHGTGNHTRNLAPFVDHNGDGIYNPNDGDYPKIKGDQALYFIYNDKLATHGTSYAPLGIEVHAMAYAYGCSSSVGGRPELTYTTFYDYKIINRSINNYHDVFVSMWNDFDLGYYNDDYIGCNVADNYGYGYNSNPTDPSYGNYPPAQGYAIVKGPIANLADGIDNNNNGIIDELNEDCKLSKFTYYNNNFPSVPFQMSDPGAFNQYYSYMSGFWKDNSPFTCGGTAYTGTNTGTPTNWAYTGDPNTGVSSASNSSCGTTNWTESTAGNIGGDRRLIINSGPFSLNAGQMQEVEYAFVTSFDSTSTANANLLSVAKLKTDIQNVRAFYNLVNKPNCLQSITIGVTESFKSSDFIVFPNPAKSVITVKSSIESTLKIDYEVLDVLGKTVIKNDTNNGNFSIAISDLSPGIYFIRLIINNSMVVKKFVKE